jgi:Flp pilus assembly protein TadG
MGEKGQTTVELALCLPLVALFLLTVVQVGLIVSDQTRLWYGAREAARTAVVDPDLRVITQAAQRSGLDGVDVSVRPQPAVRSEGRPLTVALTYRPRSIIPVLSGLVGSIELHANATMRIEQP